MSPLRDTKPSSGKCEPKTHIPFFQGPAKGPNQEAVKMPVGRIHGRLKGLTKIKRVFFFIFKVESML